MPEFGGALDRYLEAPYVDAARAEADFEEWCTANGVDCEDADAWEQYEQAINEIDAKAQAEIDAAEAQMAREAYDEIPEVYDTESDIREDVHRDRLARNTRRLLRGN